MLSLTPAATLEKNKIASTGAWLVLLDISIPGYSYPLRLVDNNEAIEWPASSGYLYSPFPFTLDDVAEDGQGGLPSFSIKVSNVTKSLVPYIEQTDGLDGARIRIRVVHSELLNEAAVLDETVDVLGCTVDLMWVTISLGGESPQRMRAPRDRYLKDHCRYRVFKGVLCGYQGDAISCNRSFSTCKELGNGSRFGGFPGIDGGMYVYGESRIDPYAALNYIYDGVSTKSSGWTSADIRALSEAYRSNDNTRVFDVTAGVGEYIVYAAPTRLGLVNFYIGAVAGGFLSPVTINVTNAQGYTESYYVWRSANSGLGPTTVKTSK